MTLPKSSNPFMEIKVRSLILRFILIIFILIFGLAAIQIITGTTQSENRELSGMLIYIFMFTSLSIWQLIELKRHHIKLSDVVGRLPSKQKWLPLVGLVILLLFFSAGAYLLSLYLISLISPSFVEILLSNAGKGSLPHKDSPFFDSFIAAFALAIVAPITEEFLFRGIIFQRWASKWGIRTSLLLSSLLFGVGHANILGATVVGLVLGILYIKTRSLLVPIACHALNNSIVVFIGLLSTASSSPRATYGVPQLQSNWWTGVVILALTLPILLRFIIKNFPRKDTAIPYCLNRG
jgi:uncharacterized protein